MGLPILGNMIFNEKEVRACYRFLEHLNETEIRIIDPVKKLPPQSFFIHSEDEFVECCKKYNGKYNLYVGINERESNGKDKQNVTSVKTIVIDIDAIRSKGFEKEPATEEELKESEKIADKIIKSVIESNQPAPLKLCSGNGYQLWFAIPEIKIDNFNRQDIEDKLQLFQDAICKKFDVNEAIDKIGDLPRIIKIWGTLNIKSQKGEQTLERPFRVAYVVGYNYERNENTNLKKQILNLEPEKVEQYETVVIDDIEISNLPPCINHLLKFYENKDGKFWYRIIQFLASFFMSVGLDKDKCKKLIFDWNKKQPYHENGEDMEIELTINRIYNKKINVPNCKKIKTATGGFPYFGLAELKLCKADSKCNKCISPVIRYKRASEKEDNIDEAINLFTDKKVIARKFYELQPFFLDRSKLWWFWNFKNFMWEQVDDVDILNAINRNSKVDTINSKEKTEILEALEQVGREMIPMEIPKTWVQFKDKIVDIKSGDIFEANPKYFITNPIPFELGDNEETPTMDRIFEEWVGKDNVRLLYEIISYCILCDYPINRLFCLVGEGSNGKSKYLELLTKFIGKKNITSTDLEDLLNSRFEKAKLYKKLICIMGETNFNTISKTSIIKKLTGGDTISFEFKNKTPFDDYNYAKILIATNGIPYLL